MKSFRIISLILSLTLSFPIFAKTQTIRVETKPEFEAFLRSWNPAKSITRVCLMLSPYGWFERGDVNRLMDKIATTQVRWTLFLQSLRLTSEFVMDLALCLGREANLDRLELVEIHPTYGNERYDLINLAVDYSILAMAIQSSHITRLTFRDCQQELTEIILRLGVQRSQIRRLDLLHTSILESDLFTLAAALSNAPNSLKTLLLDGESLAYEDGFMALAHALPNTQIENLHIVGCQVSMNLATALNECFAQRPLSRINVEESSLDDIQIQLICNGLEKNCKNLRILNFDNEDMFEDEGSSIGPLGIRAVLNVMAKADKLESLTLQANHFPEDMVPEFIHKIKRHLSLHEVILHSDISEVNLALIERTVTRNKSRDLKALLAILAVYDAPRFRKASIQKIPKDLIKFMATFFDFETPSTR